MIKGVKKLTLHDLITQTEVPVEIDNDGNVQFSDFTLEPKEIVTLALLVASPQFQEHLIKSHEEIVRPYKKQHVVKVQKDMKVGEEIVVNCQVNIPLMVEEKIKEDLKK